MRLLGLLLTLALVAVAVWWGAPAFAPATDRGTLFAAERGAATQGAATPRQQAAESGESRREHVDARPAGTLRVRDAETGEPIEGVRVLLLGSGQECARGDADGLIELAFDDIARLVFVADGYLIGGAPWVDEDTQRLREQAARGDVVEVRLFRDSSTIPLDVRFIASTGEPALGVRARFRRLDRTPDRPSPSLRASGVAPERVRAWRRHEVLISAPHLQAHGYYTGSSTREFACDGHLVVNFAEPGRYLCHAESARGEVVEQELAVPSAPVVLRLCAGAFVAGRVVDAETWAAIDRAEVFIDGSTAGAVTTGPDGRFELGPLPATRADIRFEHALFEPSTLTCVPGELPDVALTPRPRFPLMGVVVALPSSAPIRGAQVTVEVGAHVAAQTETAADGSFDVRVLESDVHVHIAAAGYLDYEEVLAHARHRERSSFELVPSSVEARVAAGLSAVVRGRVTEPGGAPREGIIVTCPAGSRTARDGRIIARGRVVGGSGLTDGQGRYELECLTDGPLRVRVAEKRDWIVQPIGDGRIVDVVLGRYHDGVDFEVPRGKSR